MDIKGDKIVSRSNWTRNESILALAPYCKIPFSKINKGNEQIQKVATLINRTPSAVAMKMCNFGRFDPELTAKGISGLQHGSNLDEKIWNEFYQNMEHLFLEAEKVVGTTSDLLSDFEINIPKGEDVPLSTQARKGQAFFRSTVLSAYDNICCITGLNIPNLLQASHIKSWKDSAPNTERTNPKNGLCLNSLHHKAFDIGIITIDTDYRILISKSAKEMYTTQVFKDYFKKYEGNKINLPNRFLPSKEFIEYHNSKLINF